MTERRGGKQALAQEAWRALFGFFMSTRRRRDEVLRRFRLTPNDVRALTSLSPTAGRTMRSLAEEWGCDASNATWIVDRLESAGLAERGPLATDRRVRLVTLTRRGAAMRARLLEEMHRAPPELLALDAEQLAALRDGLRGLPKVRHDG